MKKNNKKRHEEKPSLRDDEKKGLRYQVGLPEDVRVHNNGEADPNDG